MTCNFWDVRRYINQRRDQKALNRKWRKYYRRLKSDQGGIERKKLTLWEYLTFVKVEIRPRWDWKTQGYEMLHRLNPEGWNQTKVGLKEIFGVSNIEYEFKLKSDQGGIESNSLSKHTNDTAVCWNQTKVGLKEFLDSSVISIIAKLKSDQGGIERHQAVNVYTHLCWCWNQTKVGLKVAGRW